jgi:hypothetical protein
MKRFLVLSAIILLITSSAFGQAPEKKRYKATYVKTAPVIDGIIEEQVWQEGIWIDDFTQFEPYNGNKPSQKTEFKILYDDNDLYVAIKAFDTSPDSIVKRLTRRDENDGDNVFIIFDSFHDLRTGFLFGTTASGVKFDQMMANDGQGNSDMSWNANFWVKTSINKEGWIAEMKIPFSQLRFEKNSGDVWGLEVVRTLYRKNETSVWQQIPRDAPGIIHMMGEMSGVEKVKPRKIFDVTPYAVAKTENFQSEPGNPFREKGKLSAINGGLDAKIGLTNNMTMDLSINPDFGQVEADPSVVNLTAYETFYEEKRPFFIEGNNITNFGLGIGDGGFGNDNLFYSRRIGRRPQIYPDLKEGWYADVPAFTPILGAAKLTGKTKNGLSVGFIEAVTAEVNARIDTIGGRMYQAVEPLTNYFVGRIQKDFNGGKTLIGGILTATNRDLDPNLAKYLHKSAYTGGLDFTHYFKDKNWMFNLNSAFSLVNGSKEAIQITQRSSARYYQRPDNDYVKLDSNRTSLAGSGGRMQIQKLNGHWNFLGCVIWKTPGFETNDMGYLREADNILSILWVGYNQYNPKWIYRTFNAQADIYSVFNFGGDFVGKGFEWNANMNLKNFWSVWTGGNVNTNSLSTSMLWGGPMMKVPGSFNARAGFSTDNRKKILFNFFVSGSSGFEKSGNNINANINMSFKPFNFLSISLSPGISKNYNELQYVAQTTYGNTERYVFASIDQRVINMSLRVNLTVTPDLTLQYWGQPFVASGRYYDFKYITNSPMATEYRDRFTLYDRATQIRLVNDDTYEIYENGDGVTSYSFGKPDFNVREFLSNMVIRWEYNPGSTLYLVWSQTRSGYNPTGVMDVTNNLGDLFRDRPHNVFLIKFSYRFGLK